jgi:hypothetical protein
MPVASWWVHTRRDRSGRESAAHRRSNRPGSRRRSQSRRSEGSSREPLSAAGQGIDADNHGAAARRPTQEKSLVRIDCPRAAPSGPEPPCRRPRRPGTGPGSSTGAEHSARRPGWVASQPPAERHPRGMSHTERPARRGSSLSRRPPPAEPPSRRAFAGGTVAATGLSLSGGYLAPPPCPRPTSRPPD